MKKFLLLMVFVFSMTLVACEETQSVGKPEFSGVENVEIAQGEPFDKLENVTAVDADGTDLTHEIDTSGFVDTNREGSYTITYSVTGASGEETVVDRVITVVADAKIKGLENLESSIEVGSSFNILEGITAIDADGTDLTSQITVTSDILDLDNMSVDTSNAGVYSIEYAVTGSNGHVVTELFTLTIFEESNATILFKYVDENTENELTILKGESITLLDYVEAKDYDLAVLDNISVSYDDTIESLVVDGVFIPTEAGDYTFTYKVTGQNEVEVTKNLIIHVKVTGLIIDGTFVAVSSENINNDSKPKGVVNIYTELKGMGEYGVTVIVNKYGQVIMVRDAYGAQFDLNNPIKQGDIDEVKGLPNGKPYDEFTGGLWTDWTKSGADEFDGILGPQGTEGGIPEGGFAIFFPNGPTREIGLEISREFGIQVEVVDLEIPNFDPTLIDNIPVFSGVDDIEIDVNASFDPLLDVSATDKNGNNLTVSVAFNNVDVTKGIVPNAPRVVNTQEGRDNYAQGWYAVVYSVTDSETNQVFYVTRRVTIISEVKDAHIDGVEDVTVYKNASFDPLLGVSALDDDYTDLKDSLIVESELDLTIAGTYEITYKVTGRSGVEVVVMRTVTVIEADATFNSFAPGVTHTNLTFDLLDGIIALDYNGQDISDQITYTTNFDNEVVGTYLVTYSVTGDNGIIVTADRQIEVKQELVDAVISGVVDSQLPLNSELELLDGISATDYDGSDLTDQIVVLGEVSVDTIGTYQIEYQVTGYNNVLVSVMRTIEIIESARIVFDELYSTTVEVNSSFDPNAHVTAVDFDDSDLTANITILGSVNLQEIGTYELTYKVTGKNGIEIIEVVTISVINYPNAIINVESSFDLYLNESLDLSTIATATDYDLSPVDLYMTLPVETQNYVDNNVFLSDMTGSFDVIFQATGISGIQTEVLVTIHVNPTGLTIGGTFVEVTANNINNPSKTKDVVNIYTEFSGKGEYGVTVIVDKYGQIINVRDAYGEEIDIHNPIKQGDPTNLKGVANYGSGYYADWTLGGKDSFEGLLGPQGTEGGIPEGGFGIFFGNDTAKIIRTLGLELTREFGLLVTIHGLNIPNVNPELFLQNPEFDGVEDVVLNIGDSFDSMLGVTAVDYLDNSLTVVESFNNVDMNSEGWYAVVYSVTDTSLGHTFSVTRRVTVIG